MSQSPTPTTEEAVIAAAVRYHERTGKWPTSESGDATEDYGHDVTWKTISGVLFMRRVGRLEWFLQPLAGWRGVAPILRTAVVSWVRTGCWPTAGSMPGPFDGPWVTVDAALTLNGYAPLSKQIEQLARTVDREVILRNVSSSAIAAAAQRHHNRTGRWPTSHMDRDERVSFVPPSMIVTWGEVAAAVRQGLDGMSLDEMLGLLIAHYDGVEQEPSESSSAVEEGPTPLVADSLDPATWSKSVSLTNGQAKTFSFFQDGLSQDLAAKALRQDMASDKSFVGSLLRKQGLGQPSPLSAMLVRAAELPDGTWSVELRMQEGWQVYSTGFTQQEEATGAAQAICIRHYIQQRPPLFQPKPESETPTP